MKTNRRVVGTVVIASILALVLASCGSSSGGKKAQENSGGASRGKADTEEIKIAMITHSAPGDTFWDQVKTGAKAAAAKDNVDLVYSADPDGNKQAELIQNAIDQKVDGIAVTMAHADAVRGAIKKAQKADIPTVGLNAGIEEWKKFGLLEYFGQDESIAGEAFGEKLNDIGAKHVICVNHEQGSVSLEARCSGIKSTFDGEFEVLYVNGEDKSDISSKVTSKLQSDSDIDNVAMLNAGFAITALKAVKDANSDATVDTFDLNPELAKAIKEGKIPFAVDQQPYLQGYLAVDSLWLYKFNGAIIGGEKPVLTGPTFVTEDNISDLARFN